MKNYNINYVLFDWDGTLAKSLHVWLDTYKELARKYKVDISNLSDLEIVEKSFGLWEKGLINLGFTNVDVVCAEMSDLVAQKVKRVDLYSHVEETLTTLINKGKKLALHTSSYNEQLLPVLKFHNLQKYFSIIITKDDTIKGKPDPEIILKELSFLNAKPSETIVVGDSDHDIKAGKNAGVPTVLFLPVENLSIYRKEFLTATNPDFIISDLLELLKIVD